jgi:probable HAF family extracellular repeat protein
VAVVRGHFAFAIALLGLIGGADVDASEWRIRPLAALGGAESDASGINDAGQVVGRARLASGQTHAALWEPDGRVLDLGVLPGGAFSAARRINNRGQVAGLSEVPGGTDHATLWDTRSGAVTDIGTLGGSRSFAQDVNDSGVVAGSSDAGRGSHAFTWTAAGGFADYGNFNPQDRLLNAGFNAVNASGFAVGTSFRLLEPFRAAAAAPDGKSLVDLGAPGRTLSMANGVNDRGVIVGYASRGQAPEQAVIFHGPDDFTPLGTLGLDESWAEDVNNAGDIVGTAFSPNRFRPFLYRDGVMHDLTALLPAGSGWDRLFSAMNINERGDIVGSGSYRGVPTGYVMSLVPEPPAGAMAGAILALLCRRRRGPAVALVTAAE